MTERASQQDREPSEGAPDIGQNRILAVLMTSVFLSSVGVSILNVALPSVEHGLQASQSQLQWVLSGYALTFGVSLVPAGRAGDVFGRRTLFVVGTLLFTFSSLAAGLSSDAAFLAIARLFQGLGSGIAGPQSIGMLQQYFTGEARGKAFGWFGTTVGVAFISGPLIGGLIIYLGGEGQGWRWIFLVNVPIGLIASWLALRWIPKPVTDSLEGETLDGRRPRHDLDLIGTGILCLAISTFLIPFTIAGSQPLWWGLIPFSLLMSRLWLWWERSYAARGREPMVDLSLFAIPQFSHGVSVSSLYLLGITNVWVLIALYMQDGLGHSAIESGMVALPSAVMTIIASRLVGRYVYRWGRIMIVVGLSSLMFGLATSVGVFVLHDRLGLSEWWLLLTLSFVGVAQGSVILPTQTLTLDVIPLSYAGSSAGVMQTGQRVGAAVGITVVTSIAFAVLRQSNWTVAASIGFASIAVVIVAAYPLAIADLRAARRGVAVS